MIVNLNFPKSWQDLSQEQLRYLLDIIVSVEEITANGRFLDADDYNVQSWANIAARCLFRWNGIRIVTPYSDGWLVKKEKTEFFVSAEDIAGAAYSAAWLRKPPSVPIRLDAVGSRAAVDPDLFDLPFGEWLQVENLWIGYTSTKADNALISIAEILYKGDGDFHPSKPELLGVFYWMAGAKAQFSRMFPHFYKAGSANGAAPSADDLRRLSDAQIRALTKGDVTKEDEIYDTPTLRALTELDALAHESEEINRRYGKK